MGAESDRQLADTLDCGVPSLADDVRRSDPASALISASPLIERSSARFRCGHGTVW